MSTDTRQDQILDQQLALSAYLDALLHVDTPVQEAAAEVPLPSSPRSEIEVESQVDVAQTEVVPPVQSEPVPLPVCGAPEWARSRFQALLFEVAGLTLAVPLIKLKGVVPNEQGLTPMPGHSDLFLGVTPYQGLQSKVVDTARFVLPQDRTALLDADPGERASHLVMIDEGRWALACSRIGAVVDLEPDDVKWRTENGKRAWLAGMLIEKMCALLNVDQLTLSLQEGGL